MSRPASTAQGVAVNALSGNTIRQGGCVMARLYPRSPQDPPGKLVIEEYHPNCVEVFYIPPPHKLELSGRDPDDAEQYKTKILCICGQNDRISIFPINTWTDHADF